MATSKQETSRLTTKQVMAGFKVSDMTIFTWRGGTPTKDPLPSHQDGTRVYFKEAEMARWAKKNGVEWNAAEAMKVPGPAKTGPKPEAKKVPVAKKVKAVPPPAKKVRAAAVAA